MPAPGPLVKTLLRYARASGPTDVLGPIRAKVLEAAANGGRQIQNVSAGGKSYSFGGGYNIEALTAALDEAEACWADMSATELANILDRRPIKTATVRFS